MRRKSQPVSQVLVGLTSGCYDVLHPGHLRYLERCSEKCDRLLVGVDSDDLVRQRVGDLALFSGPIFSAAERVEMVRALRCVSLAFVLHTVEMLDTVAETFDVSLVFKNQRFHTEPVIYGTRGVRDRMVILPDVPGLPSTCEIVLDVLARSSR